MKTIIAECPSTCQKFESYPAGYADSLYRRYVRACYSNWMLAGCVAILSALVLFLASR